jgi:hypothetical protein
MPSAAWSQKRDQNNRVYYVNHETKMTTWNDPRPKIVFGREQSAATQAQSEPPAWYLTAAELKSNKITKAVDIKVVVGEKVSQHKGFGYSMEDTYGTLQSRFFHHFNIDPVKRGMQSGFAVVVHGKLRHSHQKVEDLHGASVALVSKDFVQQQRQAISFRR